MKSRTNVNIAVAFHLENLLNSPEIKNIVSYVPSAAKETCFFLKQLHIFSNGLYAVYFYKGPFDKGLRMIGADSFARKRADYRRVVEEYSLTEEDIQNLRGQLSQLK